jgi:phosphatidylserine decarboxylase
MNMTEAETDILIQQLVPGRMTLRKLLGQEPFDIEDKADYVLKSARETVTVEDERGAHVYVVRIADYYVGKILTWVEEGEEVVRGQKMGLITWGSQTDLFIEDSDGLEIAVEAGEYVHAGETIVATY